MAVITISTALSTKVITNETTSKTRPLSLLSSFASIMPSDQRGATQRDLISSATPIAKVNATKEARELKRSGSLSRSLSRSFSSRNLLQAATATATSQTCKRRKHHHPDQSFFAKGTGARSPPLVPCRSSSTLAARTPLSPTLQFTNEEEYSGRSPERESEEINLSLGKRESSPAMSDTIDSFVDEILNNVYQCHAMRLPESCSIGSIMKNQKIVDDYNYEVVSNTPLQIPPRLPSASESFTIAERSLEERNNWGWYA
mmetsp:Transcript_18291/g.37727  ORF Transcript_18291/g.37727 Transcript_18291/m.37727 type:complete len:258 (-) Transcript_18291:71-844(-)